MVCEIICSISQPAYICVIVMMEWWYCFFRA